jgi:hypothetical protein
MPRTSTSPDPDTSPPPDLMLERLIGLAHAARRLPPGREDKPVSPSTIWRWVVEGVRLSDGSRLRLEAVRIGGRWVTSVEALSRFASRQTPGFPSTPSPEARVSAGRCSDDALVSKALGRRGI